jgi:hypothetical protein
MLVKILGAIDILSFIIFLTLTFGFSPYLRIVLFCAGLLFMKGLFILIGEPLSAIDILASISLIISIFFTLPSILLWTLAFLLLSKGMVSFI